MLASSSGSRSRSGVAIAAICPPGRSAAQADRARLPPTRSATASTGPPASARAQAAHLRVHRLAADPDRGDPGGRGHLEQEQPDATAGAQHQQPAAGRQAEPGQHQVRGSGGQRRGRRVGERGRGADRRDQGGVDDDELGVPAGAVREVRHRHHPVAGRQAGDPGAHAVDDPGDVVAQDARHPQPRPPAVGPVPRVDRIDPGRAYRHPHLTRPGHRIGHPDRPQLLRAAELANQHRSHKVLHSAAGRSASAISRRGPPGQRGLAHPPSRARRRRHVPGSAP